MDKIVYNPQKFVDKFWNAENSKVVRVLKVVDEKKNTGWHNAWKEEGDMLKEKIFYKDELPVNVITANIKEYPIHFHDDMEVVYVLEGSLILRNG